MNAWAMPGPLGVAVPERIRAIGDELARMAPDVVAFQEVWTPAARAALVRAGTDAGLEYTWSGEGTLMGGGLLLMARWPLRDARHVRYSLPQVPPRPDHADYYVSKGFIDARLEHPDGAVRLFTTHLQARYARHVEHAYRAVRFGDLNFREGDAEYQVLTGLTGLRDAAAEIDARAPTCVPSNPFRGPGSGTKRIDYVFVRDGANSGLSVAAVRRAFDAHFERGGRELSFSNHAGVEVEIGLHGEPTALASAAERAAGLAADVLAEGREHALRNRADARQLAGAGWLAALATAAGGRHRHISRRRLLRTALSVAGIAALTPSVGYTVLAEVYTPDAVEAYERLSRRAWAVASPTGRRLA